MVLQNVRSRSKKTGLEALSPEDGPPWMSIGGETGTYSKYGPAIRPAPALYGARGTFFSRCIFVIWI